MVVGSALAVTSGTGKGPERTHQSRYSVLAQPRAAAGASDHGGGPDEGAEIVSTSAGAGRGAGGSGSAGATTDCDGGSSRSLIVPNSGGGSSGSSGGRVI